VPHLPREVFAARKAVHVTQRVQPGVGHLRRQGPAQVLLGALRDSADRFHARVVHYSIQGNHLHLILEVEGHRALSKAMHAMAIRMARRLNARLGRRGGVFADRFHSHVLQTRREIANAIRYVVGNYRHHAREYLPPHYRDPLASRPDAPLARPRLWLLRDGWRLEPPGRQGFHEYR
jgi:REP element-mobilizing transposase RayT